MGEEIREGGERNKLSRCVTIKHWLMFSVTGICFFSLPSLLPSFLPLQSRSCFLPPSGKKKKRERFFQWIKLKSSWCWFLFSFFFTCCCLSKHWFAERWPVCGTTAGAVNSFSRVERIYWPLRQLRYTSRSLAPAPGPSLALNTGDLCVSLSFGWQLWVKHSRTDHAQIYTFAILKRHEQHQSVVFLASLSF